MADAEDPSEGLYSTTCPFCTIGESYQCPIDFSNESHEDLMTSIPEEVDVNKTSPACFLVLNAPTVMAFLDILPMTKGHLLVTTRGHRRKVENMEPEESRDIGFWLPILAKAVRAVTGTSDYNLVQNNGIRAAQVVPHVHFHIIPRPAHVPELKNKSWTMFGKGQREDLDDEDGEKLASELRNALRTEINTRFGLRRAVKL